MKRLAGALMVALWVGGGSGCSRAAGSGVERELEVGPYKAECVGVDYGFCWRVRPESQDRFEFLYEPVAGFDYRWGMRYRIRVRETTVDAPAQDAPGVHRRLLEVISAETVPESTFTLTVTAVSPEDGRRLIAAPDADGFVVHGGETFACGSEEACASLGELLDAGVQRVVLDLAYPDTAGAMPALASARAG